MIERALDKVQAQPDYCVDDGVHRSVLRLLRRTVDYMDDALECVPETRYRSQVDATPEHEHFRFQGEGFFSEMLSDDAYRQALVVELDHLAASLPNLV